MLDYIVRRDSIMNKNMLVLSAATAALLALSGCGSSSSSDNQTATTGVGYYVDNAVVGVDYVCGDQKGKTGAGGAFTFEKGEKCSFTLAGIPLKTVPADNLVDGEKVVENNVTVAQLLQSIDSDGNLSNGIQITDAVVKAIKDALDGSTSATKENVLKDKSALETVVSAVGQKVEGVSGSVKPVQEVEQHLEQTQTDVTKGLLAGKTFYVVHISNTEHFIDKVSFNKNVTEVTGTGLINDTGTETDELTVSGDQLIWLSDSSYTVIVGQHPQYIVAADFNVDNSSDGQSYLFSSKSEAEAFYYKKFPKTSGSATDVLKGLIVGKTFYYVQNDDFGHEEQAGFNLAKIVFHTDGTMVWDEINTIDAGKPYNTTYHFKNNHLFLFDNDEGSGEYSFIKQNNDYIEINELNENNNPAYLFDDEQKAKDFVNKMNNNNSASSSGSATDLKFTTGILSANSWYRIEYTDNNDTYCDGKFTFDDKYNLTVSYLKDDGTEKTFNGSYSIEDGAMVTHHDGKKDVENLISNTSSVLNSVEKSYDDNSNDLLHTMNIKYFKNRADAIDFGNSRGTDCSQNF